MKFKHKLAGSVASVLLGSDAHSLVTTKCDRCTATFDGLEGDKHSGQTRRADARTPYYPRGTVIRNDRQVSLVSVEDLVQIATAMNVPEIHPEWLGANLLLRNIPKLTLLPPCTRLAFAGGAVLVVEHENQPCIGPGKVIATQYARPELGALFPKAALQLRGVVACVEKPGFINAGDEVIVEVPHQILYELP